MAPQTPTWLENRRFQRHPFANVQGDVHLREHLTEREIRVTVSLAKGNGGGDVLNKRNHCQKTDKKGQSAMAFQAVPNGIKVEMNHRQNGVPVVNRFYVTQAGSVSSADLDDVAVVALAFWNEYKAACHVSLVLENITLTDVSVDGGVQLIVPLTTGNTGGATSAPAAANAAVVASLRTARTGRSYRGRFYFGGLPNANLADAQTISGGQAAVYAGYMTDLMDALTAIGKTLVVVSRWHAKALRVIAAVTEVISILVDTKVDSQRRRTAN